MPYLHLNTTVSISGDEKHSLCVALGELMPLIPGKTRDNTMMNIVDGCFMEKGDKGAPCLSLEVRVFGPAPDENKNDFIGQVTRLFEDKFKIAPGDMYINIVEFNDWGSNGAYRRFGG